MSDNNKTMKIHTTNYYNTFILIADDCKADVGIVPPLNADKQSIANIQFDIIINNPYTYTSDDVLFIVLTRKLDLIEDDYEDARRRFFSKGQACLRSSPLTKRYGWGIHCNEFGKVSIFGVETDKYQELLNDSTVTKIKALRSSR